MSPLLLGFLGLLLVAGELVVRAAAQGGTGSAGGDKEVLVELKRFLQENNKVNRGAYDTWPESEASPCGWTGVGCDAAGRVASLDLSGASISGPAFGNFSRLPALARLDLSDNTISGAGDVGQCRGLVHLSLSHNLIDGSLDLSGLTLLQTLDVSWNRLIGGVAANFTAICADLVVFNVSTNGLTGDITGMFDGCPRLEYVDLSSNKFTGELWPGIARFRQFSAAENNLSGGIPPAIFPDGCNLESLDLSANNLTGSFPDTIAKCVNLTYLSLWGNGFTGVIPAGLGKLAVIETIILGKNKFDRHIPSELKNRTKLQFLDMSNNMFGGDVQDTFGRFASLRYLVLHHNNYTGGIVSSGVLQLPLLARLDLSSNDFSGELPPELADMKSLKYLMLAYNQFSGSIPPAYGRLTELQALDLSHNKLSGGIPATVGNLTSLLWLMLANNQLSGEIPREIGKCTSLLWLNLADNELTGKIPPEMAAIGSNPGPTFAKNRNDSSVLAGSGECQAMRRWIPASYPPFSFVYSIMTRENCRSIWDRILKGYGIVPICTNSSSPVRSNTISGYVQLSSNRLSGEIPPEIGAMLSLSLLHLDDNRLTGRPPPEISRLPLVVLNVSRNNISGAIPSEISRIRCLEMMDLSYNNFSGELPGSLSQLTELNRFNVSYNPLLSGNAPATAQFGTFDEQSFLGDPFISFQQAAGKQPPPEAAEPAVRGRGMSPKSVAVWFVFSLISAFVAGAFVFFVANIRARFPVDQDPDPESFSREPQQVRLRQVLFAAVNFVAAVRVVVVDHRVLLLHGGGEGVPALQDGVHLPRHRGGHEELLRRPGDRAGRVRRGVPRRAPRRARRGGEEAREAARRRRRLRARVPRRDGGARRPDGVDVAAPEPRHALRVVPVRLGQDPGVRAPRRRQPGVADRRHGGVRVGAAAGHGRRRGTGAGVPAPRVPARGGAPRREGQQRAPGRGRARQGDGLRAGPGGPARRHAREHGGGRDRRVRGARVRADVARHDEGRRVQLRRAPDGARHGAPRRGRRRGGVPGGVGPADGQGRVAGGRHRVVGAPDARHAVHGRRAAGAARHAGGSRRAGRRGREERRRATGAHLTMKFVDSFTALVQRISVVFSHSFPLVHDVNNRGRSLGETRGNFGCLGKEEDTIAVHSRATHEPADCSAEHPSLF